MGRVREGRGPDKLETELPKKKTAGRGRFATVTSGDDSHDAIRRMVLAAMSGSSMRRFAAAAALLIAGKRGSDLRAPEPLVQVGFEPSEEEMEAIVQMAVTARRDLIHVGCHDDGSGKPTGMIAVVYFDGGRARPHRRCGLLCAPGSTTVLLAGVSDEEDEPCHFTQAPGEKMIRVAGYPVDDFGAGIHRDGELWFARADTLNPADFDAVPLRIPGVLQGPGASPPD